MVAGDRFFIDERIGCIAVRDREQSNPEDRGLEKDTPGVVKFWMGNKVNELCPTCLRVVSSSWEINEDFKKEASKLCRELNDQVQEAP
jgi:hypothetical protein